MEEKVVSTKDDNSKVEKKAPIVKTKADLDREKKEKEDAEKAENNNEDDDSDTGHTVDQQNISMAPPPPSMRASAPPPPTGAGKSAVPAPPTNQNKKTENTADEQSGVVEGNLIIVKPPIVVRICRFHWSKSPFQLISELMEMGIFTSMNQAIEEDVARQVAKVKVLNWKLSIMERSRKLQRKRKSLLMKMMKSF